jgi:thiol-disulfide isomerase/thioredoxin
MSSWLFKLRKRRVKWLAAVLAAALLAATGCTADPTTDGPTAEPAPMPFGTCPPAPGPAEPTGAAAPEARPLPAVTLPCFNGGAPVALAGLGRPAVINLWASWCGPCRTELPELQAFADGAGDRLLVLGVNTDDTRDAAAWAGADFGVSFPSVFDPDGTLKAGLGRTAIPVTLFVDPRGNVTYQDVSGALTVSKLQALTAEHLGIST